MKKRVIKKRSFLLLEILIAVSLIILCEIPLISNPFHFYKREIKHLEELSLTRIKKEALYEIKELLFKNEIPWTDFAINKKKDAPPRILCRKTVIIKDLNKKEVTVFYRIWSDKEQKCQDGIICRKVGVQISFDRSFQGKDIYILFAQKDKNTSENELPGKT